MSKIEWGGKRNRGKTLLIVEGKHEKEQLLYHLLKAFPMVNISVQNIITYETNIYALIAKIISEYGEDWDREDIDLPFLISNGKQSSSVLRKRDFTDIYLIFDYERHDPSFSETNILRMQRYFSHPEDVGKLYINYPMVESYLDLKSIPDASYESRKYSSKNKRGSVYKRSVANSCISRLMDIPYRVDKYLSTQNINASTRCSLINLLTNCTTIAEIGEITSTTLADENAKCYFQDCFSFSINGESCSYNQYMQWVFSQVIVHNIRKANKIQRGVYDFPLEEIEVYFHELDACDILSHQNILSRLDGDAQIDVLNMSVFLIPDYNPNIAFSSLL